MSQSHSWTQLDYNYYTIVKKFKNRQIDFYSCNINLEITTRALVGTRGISKMILHS